MWLKFSCTVFGWRVCEVPMWLTGHAKNVKPKWTRRRACARNTARVVARRSRKTTAQFSPQCTWLIGQGSSTICWWMKRPCASWLDSRLRSCFCRKWIGMEPWRCASGIAAMSVSRRAPSTSSGRAALLPSLRLRRNCHSVLRRRRPQKCGRLNKNVSLRWCVQSLRWLRTSMQVAALVCQRSCGWRRGLKCCLHFTCFGYLNSLA